MRSRMRIFHAMKFKSLLTIFFGLSSIAVMNSCGIKGCMDPLALNYDGEATKYDGSCEYAEFSTAIILNMHFRRGSDLVQVDDEFTPSGMNKAQITRMRFYLANVEARTSSGSSGGMERAMLFDMDPDEGVIFTQSAALQVDPGTYTTLDFDLGVTPELNNVLPSDYDENDPLAVEDMFWVWATKRKFVEIDGNYDLDGDGSLELSYFFHTGLDETFRDVPAMATDITIEEGEKKELDVYINLDELYGGLALDSLFQTHTDTSKPGSLEAAMMFNTSLANSFEL